MTTYGKACFFIGALTALASPAAQAQWAVVDAPAIVQLIQQVQTMNQQLQTARSQLSQAQLALQSMTGHRGMQRLLSGTSRNYLPADWSQLTASIQGSAGSYSILGAKIAAALQSNTILSAQRMATLSFADQQRILAVRRSNALRQTLAQEALANASARFASIQTLISAIPSANDQKAALDLQARILAEVGMLQNERTKLEMLFQAAAAEDASNEQQRREYIVASHGRFDTRLQPVP